MSRKAGYNKENKRRMNTFEENYMRIVVFNSLENPFLMNT